jgi:magnesium-protoporphyrin O-methyltransferase
MFDPATAQREARRYRRRGPHRTARRIVELLRERGVGGAEVLEVGGGIGVVAIELLEDGASRATNVELSPSYESAAVELLRERGLDERVDRRLGDFVTGDAPEADLVVLDRVICCYPDAAALVSAAGRRARRTLVLTYPRYGVGARLLVRTVNLWLRLRGCGFRTYAHRPELIVGAAAACGLRPAQEGGLVWRLIAFERA